MIEDIKDYYQDEKFLSADGFHDAIIGVDERSMRLIYSVKKCIQILMESMTEEEAIEFFEFNIECAFVGEQTPI